MLVRKSGTEDVIRVLVEHVDEKQVIYLLDYSSIYHAILNNIDPTPVKAIEFIKNRID